jgi:hypothetical protein
VEIIDLKDISMFCLFLLLCFMFSFRAGFLNERNIKGQMFAKQQASFPVVLISQHSLILC